MKICRIYIKPHGEKWCDLPLRPEQDLGVVFQVMRTEGALMMPSAFCIPSEQVHHMTLLEVVDPPQPLMPWTPQDDASKPN